MASAATRSAAAQWNGRIVRNHGAGAVSLRNVRRRRVAGLQARGLLTPHLSSVSLIDLQRLSRKTPREAARLVQELARKSQPAVGTIRRSRQSVIGPRGGMPAGASERFACATHTLDVDEIARGRAHHERRT